jgi:predicted small lipoprotein YifL
MGDFLISEGLTRPALARMARPVRGPAATLLVVILVTAGLAGCGRKGPLDPPPGAALTTPAHTAAQHHPAGAAQDEAARNGFDTQGNPVAPPGQKKSFILDPLLR